MCACYFHTETQQPLDANVILHCYMGQAITSAAKLAAAFTSLSPDVDVSPLFFPGAIGSPSLAEKTRARQHMPVRAVSSQRLDIPEAFNQAMFSISSLRVPLLDLWSSQ